MRAVQVPKPHAPHELIDRPMPEPGPREVRIKVEACGICHSDSFAVDGTFPGIRYPIVPGHEIAGRIDAVGPEVTTWSVGQRVGVGWFGGNCGVCPPCRRGDFIHCRVLKVPGINYDGGYAEQMIAPIAGLASIPDELSAVEAGPLLCAGITTFNALRNSGARAGDLVAILGIGGLGHLGVQFARRMGFHTVAIARGQDKKELALKLGAHRYIDSQTEDVAKVLNGLGGAKLILATVTNAKAMSAVKPQPRSGRRWRGETQSGGRVAGGGGPCHRSSCGRRLPPARAEEMAARSARTKTANQVVERLTTLASPTSSTSCASGRTATPTST